MTTLTLLVKPVPSTSLTMQKTINNPWQSSTTSSALIQTHPHSLIQQFPECMHCYETILWLCLQATAAESNLDEDDWPPCHSSFCFSKADNMHLSNQTQLFKQETWITTILVQPHLPPMPMTMVINAHSNHPQPWWPITCHSLLHTSLLTWFGWHSSLKQQNDPTTQSNNNALNNSAPQKLTAMNTPCIYFTDTLTIGPVNTPLPTRSCMVLGCHYWLAGLAEWHPWPIPCHDG